jgi:hypothetical protein
MEKLQLHKLRLAQAMLQVSDLEVKLWQNNSRKNKTVDKIYSVMETWW